MTRNERKRDNRYRLMLIVSVIVWAIVCILVLQNAKSWDDGYKPVKTAVSQPYADDSWQTEEDENAQIEAALLSQAHEIQNCTVTWYTNNTCGKEPGDSAYGITYSGEQTDTHCTVAVDPGIIPLGSDVCVQYADGTAEWFRATDTGVSGAHVDIYTDDYDQAIENGAQLLTVYYIPPQEVDTD